ncbi:PIN domain-containing protein [Nocardia salmonicida]|uniref:PIN domain-containing protein n=1 Tax=Nocardia salmonicida TaxID=53431 RepID=UPI0033F5F645
MIRLLIDTSTWLDLAKRRDGQRWIWTLHDLVENSQLELLVPNLVLEEFTRNRPRIETSMTASVAERFRLIKKDLNDFAGDDHEQAIAVVEGLAHNIPLIGAMTTRNFDDILKLLSSGRQLDPTPDQHARVVQRGLDKRAPFHRSRNSVADALLIELYATELDAADEAGHTYAFITSNSDDFSKVNGDKRDPHPDLAEMFADGRTNYGLGMAGLEDILAAEIGREELDAGLAGYDFSEDPRRLDEIIEAEQEYFDRIWYHRSLMHEYELEDAGDIDGVARLRKIAGPGRKRVEEKFDGAENLGPYSDFELGMLHGKLSTLRWVLGSEWDFLDT